MQKTENSSVKIIPLGGLEQIGMNMTAFMYEDSIIVVDCGLSFPDDDIWTCNGSGNCNRKPHL